MPRVDESRILNPGILRHQITWQRKAVTGQNSFGEATYTWADVVTCRAQMKQMQGREFEAAQQRWPDARYQIIQHHYAGLDSEMRISWYVDGAVLTLDVLDIADRPGTGRYQIITAKDHQE